MVHKFVSNNNKGKVNTMEIGPDYTKIHNVVAPTADGDPVNKKYFEDNLPESSGGLFIVKQAPNGVLDKKYSEILEAAKTSLVVLMNSGDDYVNVSYLFSVGEDEGTHSVIFYDFGDGATFGYIADAADGYPAISEDPSSGDEPIAY